MEVKTYAIINPFKINIDPMERLLLLNFEKDPDALYIGFEPQVFEDNIHGKGHIVIGWRADGRVDVYYQRSLKLDPRTAENPSAMPLVLLNDFYFIRKNNTEAKISIDGKLHKLDELPVPMDGTRMFYARYSTEPLIATINPACDDELKPFEIEHQQRVASLEDQDIELEWLEDKPYIRRITQKNGVHPVTVSFKGAFPDIRFLKNNTVFSGEFEIKGHPSTGKIGGNYKVEKNDAIKIRIIPAKGWEPIPTKLSLRLMYSVAKIFKKWPTTYEWTAHIQESGNGVYHMRSRWDRKR